MTSWFDFDDIEPGDPDGLAWMQREAVEASIVALETHDSTMVVQATGTGKTQVAGAFINTIQRKQRRARFLFLAHRDELIQQAMHRLLGQFLSVGQEQEPRSLVRALDGVDERAGNLGLARAGGLHDHR